MSLTIYLEIGHEASLRSKSTPEGFTHDWEVYVRGCNGADISHYVDKVMFHLHETFPKPKRVIKEPPYLLKMSGYAGFVLPIDVYLKNSGGEPRKIRFGYDLQLQPNGPKIVRSQREKYTFTNVSEEFRTKLIKGGAQFGSYDSESGKVSNSMADDRNLISKPKLSSGSTDFKKVKPRDEPNSFQDLFGPPIKKFNVKEPPPVVKSDKKPEKSSGSSKKSPHKDPPLPPQREKSEKSEKKKDKDEKSKKDKPKEHKENRPSSNSKNSSLTAPNLPPPVDKKGRSPTPSKIKEKDRDRDKEREKEKEKEKERERDRDKQKEDKSDKKKQRHGHKENKHSKEVAESKKIEKQEKLEKIDKPAKDKPPEAKREREKDKDERKHKHKKKDKDRKEKTEKSAEKEKHKSSEKLDKTDKKSAALFGSPKSDGAPPIGDDKQQPISTVISNKRPKPLSSLIDENSSNSSKSSRGSSPVIMEPQLPPPAPILPPPPPKSEKKKDKKERKKEKKSEKEHDRKRKRKDVPEADSGDEEVLPVKREKPEEDDDDERKVSSSEDANIPPRREPNRNAVNNELTEDYIRVLMELQHKILGIREDADLRRVVSFIVAAGRYEVSDHTFDFDLCQLDRATVRQLQDFFAQMS